jgi:hypothetical protein
MVVVVVVVQKGQGPGRVGRGAAIYHRERLSMLYMLCRTPLTLEIESPEEDQRLLIRQRHCSPVG